MRSTTSRPVAAQLRGVIVAVALLPWACGHVTLTQQQRDNDVDAITIGDVGLDVFQFGVLVYQMATGAESPPRAQPDAGSGRHFVSVPDAPPAVPVGSLDAGLRGAGSSLEAYEDLLDEREIFPLESCLDVAPIDISAGVDFRCIQNDGRHVLSCGHLGDAGWNCHSAIPDGG